jgi:hypothetical protein
MSTSKEDGGPAFPSEGEGHGNPLYHSPGMSLRDWFAGQALVEYAGLVTLTTEPPGAVAAQQLQIARLSYQQADAMLKARPPNDP